MQWNDSEDGETLEGLTPSGWTASREVVSRYVQNTMLEAVRIANLTLDNPSEQAVMQLFQAMIDRTSFENNGSIAVH